MPAYPNCYPVTYQPYGQNYYQPYQPVQQPAQQPASQPVQASILWVGNEQEAQNYPVAPNNAVALWDSSIPVIYLKQADASGKPTIKAFDLVERGAARPQKAAEYATKDEMESLSQAVDSLRSEVRNVKKEMDGAKKTRRREVEEDDE